MTTKLPLLVAGGVDINMMDAATSEALADRRHVSTSIVAGVECQRLTTAEERGSHRQGTVGLQGSAPAKAGIPHRRCFCCDDKNNFCRNWELAISSDFIQGLQLLFIGTRRCSSTVEIFLWCTRCSFFTKQSTPQNNLIHLLARGRAHRSSMSIYWEGTVSTATHLDLRHDPISAIRLAVAHTSRPSAHNKRPASRART